MVKNRRGILVTYIKRKSKKQEERTAKEFSGRTQLASGAIETLKGDVRTGEHIGGSFNEDDFLIENKFTDSLAYKLTLPTWDKISKEAFRDNFRTPLMQIDIQDLQLVLMDENTFIADYKDRLSEQVTPSLSVGGKSISLNKLELERIFSTGVNVVIIDFYNVNTRLYLMLKDDFLRLMP